ncbi:uncharacterized protein LOC130645129 [Hydractinia symbiolongicarpus]|uniref:uncharacterized protein LOC130645129 n=1 Tax=Hydractinia symbiolongicarpus TaxID=13093 RepID=UPI0025516EAA|nr:uncharacterized protein LOC130645129 [Hydractinia symbiolongicarpus]
MDSLVQHVENVIYFSQQHNRDKVNLLNSNGYVFCGPSILKQNESMIYSVDHWEALSNKISVPICQPNKLTPGVFSRYVRIKLDDFDKELSDARSCMNLFVKKHYRVRRTYPEIDSEEADLISFLYHYIKTTTPMSLLVTIRDKDFCFERNRQLNDVSYKRCCADYVSDNYGIVLFKTNERKLKLFYLDLLSGYTDHGDIKCSPRRFGVRFYKCVLWVIHEPVACVSEIWFVRFGIDRLKPTKLFLTTDRNHGNLVHSVTASRNLLVFSGLKTYLFFDEKTRVLSQKTFPDNVFNKISTVYAVNKMLLIQGKPREALPPLLYLATVFPDVRIRKEIDLAKLFTNYKHYIPFGFELDVFPSAMKALVRSREMWSLCYVVVVDLRLGIVSQILTYIDCFWQHKLLVDFSRNGKEIRLIGKERSSGGPGSKPGTEYMCIKFSVWNGMKLTDLCKKTLTHYFSWETIQTFGLSKHLLKDIEDNYT